jgi:hypothetical protein
METIYFPLIHFLKEELQLPTNSIKLALKYSEQISNLLPIKFWQYGLILLVQLDQIYDWLYTS